MRLPRLQVTMTHNQRFRITLMQILQQLPQRTLLCLSTCVLWCLAVCSQSADIAYTDTVLVVVLAVSTYHLLRSPLLYRPVCGNHIVVSATLPAEGAMIAVNVRHADGTPRPISGAMHDNKCNFSHTIQVLSHRLHRFHRSFCTRFALPAQSQSVSSVQSVGFKLNNPCHLCNLWALN